MATNNTSSNKTSPSTSSSSNISQRANDASRALGGNVGEMAAKAITTSSDYLNAGKKYVSENPMTGVAIAAGTGAVLGFLATSLANGSKKH